MRIGSTTALGARRALALDSITAAEAYAGALNRALVHARPVRSVGVVQ